MKDFIIWAIYTILALIYILIMTSGGAKLNGLTSIMGGLFGGVVCMFASIKITEMIFDRD